MIENCLVVGAAGGVGLELVRLLVDRGVTVFGTVLDAAEAERLKAAVPSIAGIAQIDLSDADAVSPALAALFEQHRCALEAVAVCAAIAPFGPLETTPLATLRRTLEINTVADVAVYQATMAMMRRNQGRYVFIVSHAGRVGIPFLGPYVASKFALEGVGDVMRREAAKWGVRVTLLEPGGIKTKMVYDQIALMPHKLAALPESERHLYGDLYRAFAGFLTEIEHALPPRAVAQAIVDAFVAETPEPRYQVGDDAIQAIAMARSHDDRELDAVYDKLFPRDPVNRPTNG